MPRPRQLSLFREYAQTLTVEDRATVTKAMAILDRTLRKHGVCFDKPETVTDFLKLHFAGQPYETFVVLHLDAQNRLIEADSMFRGSLTQTSVYPREIVKECLRLNSAAVIFAHCHPSGVASPSRADEFLTGALKAALALVDVSVLDHVVIANTTHCSFAQRGLMQSPLRYG